MTIWSTKPFIKSMLQWQELWLMAKMPSKIKCRDKRLKPANLNLFSD